MLSNDRLSVAAVIREKQFYFNCAMCARRVLAKDSLLGLLFRPICDVVTRVALDA